MQKIIEAKNEKGQTISVTLETKVGMAIIPEAWIDQATQKGKFLVGERELTDKGLRWPTRWKSNDGVPSHCAPKYNGISYDALFASAIQDVKIT